MGSLASSEIIGGASVEIGGNIEPLKASIAQARSLVQQISAVSGTIYFDAKASKIQTSITQAVSQAQQAASARPLTIKFDAAAIVSQFGTTLQEMQRLADAHPITLSLTTQPGGNGGGGGGGGGNGGGSGRGNGGGGSSWLNRNPLSARGLGPMVGGLAIAAIANEALRVAGQVGQAMQIAAHPERQLVGYGMQAQQDPAMQAMAQQLAANASQQGINQAAEGIPILGNVFKIGDAIGDVSGQHEDTARITGEAMKSHEYIRQLDQSLKIAKAEDAGDQLGAMQGKHEQERKPTTDAVAAAQANYDKIASGQSPGAGQSWAQTYFPNISEAGERVLGVRQNAVDERSAAAKADLEHSKATAAEQQQQQKAEEDRLQRQIDAQKRMAYVSASATMAQAQGEQLMAGGGPGSQSAARGLFQRAALDSFDAKANYELEKAPDEKKDEVGKQNTADRAKLVADQQKEIEDATRESNAKIAANEAAANSSRLRANKQFFEANIAEIKAAGAAELEAVQGKDAAVIKSVQDRIDAKIDEATKEHDLQISESKTLQADQVNAYDLRMQHRDFDAEELIRHDQANDRINAAPADEQEGMRATEKARQHYASWQHGQEISNASAMLVARQQSAQAVQNQEPLLARATEAVARARNEIATSPAELRAQAVKTVSAELRADESQQDELHSGGYAKVIQKGDLLFNPIDAEIRDKDRTAAAKAYGAGLKAIGADGVAVPPGGPQTAGSTNGIPSASGSTAQADGSRGQSFVDEGMKYIGQGSGSDKPVSLLQEIRDFLKTIAGDIPGLGTMVQ